MGRNAWCLGGIAVLVLGCGGEADVEAASEDTIVADAEELEGSDAAPGADVSGDEDGAAAGEPVEVSEAEPMGARLADGEELPEGPVPAGVYTSSRFTVPLSFEIADDGWVAEPPATFWLGLSRGEGYRSGQPDPAGVSIVGVQLPTSVPELAASIEAAVDDRFTVVGTEPTELGGLSGVLISGVVTGSRSFDALRSSAGDWIVIGGERELEIHVLETGGQPVTVWVGAETGEFEQLRSDAAPLLESLRFAPRS